MLLYIIFRLRFDDFLGLSACNGVILISAKAKVMARNERGPPMARVKVLHVETFSLAATSGTVASMTMPCCFFSLSSFSSI